MVRCWGQRRRVSDFIISHLEVAVVWMLVSPKKWLPWELMVLRALSSSLGLVFLQKPPVSPCLMVTWKLRASSKAESGPLQNPLTPVWELLAFRTRDKKHLCL